MSKRIAILGAGESGTGAALLAQHKGFDVFVSDLGNIRQPYRDTLTKAGIRFEEGCHSTAEIMNAVEIIKSPGIPDHVPVVQEARSKGIKVISEIEFASRYTNAKMVAITGSNGKTTTTLLTHHLLKKAGLKVGLAGNVGDSLARQVIEDKVDYYVLELSSFQLDGVYEFKADVAVVLNITPDHLDRYDNDFSKYVDSKFRITQNQTPDDYLITFADDKTVMKEVMERELEAFNLNISLDNKLLNGGYLSGEQLMVNVNNHITQVFSIDSNILPLTGKHNMVNTMAGVLAALACGVEEAAIKKALSSFKNAPHRLEDVGVVKGVRYVNDSKATNIDSVKYALDSFDHPIVWIAGGIDKGNDYSQIDELVYEKVKALICLGKDNTKLLKAFGEKLPLVLESEDMNEAVKLANEIAHYGDVVLLSPACASFDLFKNYEERGDHYRGAIKSLEKSQRKLNMISFL